MPLQKIALRPGLNREGTSYSNEGGWYDGDKIRFRSGLPEKIGGWTQYSANQFLGVCRSLWSWQALNQNQYLGVGTTIKYYIASGGSYSDITPIYYPSYPNTDTLTNPFTTASGSATVIVSDANYSPNAGDYVIFSGATAVGGVIVSGEYKIQSIQTASSYTITASNPATSTTTGGGSSVVAQYELPSGNTYASNFTGWGTGTWGGSNGTATPLGNNPFSTTSGSGTVIVSQPANGYITNAGSFVIGQQYQIVSVGSTNFTLVGAANNTVGTIFTATGVGTGSGTAGNVWVNISGSSTFAGLPSTTVNGVATSLLNGTFVMSNLTASSYAITLPSANAGSFATGKTYIISYVGTTDFTAIGASANTVGTTFTATGPGSGTGTATITATSTTTGGGSNVIVRPQYGSRAWGTAYSSTTVTAIRLWSNDNFGQDLVIAPRGGNIYYWQATNGLSTRSVALSALADQYPSTTLSAPTGVNFSLGGTTITVSNAAGIYPYAFVTGNGIPSGTQVSSSYVIGSTTVNLTAATTASATGNYIFSFAGQYVPTTTNQVITSAIQQFVIAFGSNSYNGGTYSGTFNPMLVRWSDQSNPYQWIPQVTNQSGEFLLSNGSYIMGARATRQEILVWTNSALYSMQYVGYPYVWSFQILMDNITVMSPNCMITINNITYWMGNGKFYMYNGSVQTLPCSLRQYIYDDINQSQAFQVFAGANEGFNEVWWFYVSNESANNTIDKYVIYNYLDKTWSYGTFQTTQVSAGSFVIGQQYVISTVGTTNFMAIGAANNNVGTYFVASGTGSGTGSAWALNGRTAWLDSGTNQYPIAAYYNSRLLYHESGVDDVATGTTKPIYAYVQSSDFGIMASDQNNSGQHFGFVWRILPDVNFNGSNQANPQVTMQILPRQNSGTAYGSADAPTVISAQAYASPTPQEFTVQQFTGEVYTRLRGRQMSLKCSSNTIGTAWQLGINRYDVKQDGRR